MNRVIYLVLTCIASHIQSQYTDTYVNIQIPLNVRCENKCDQIDKGHFDCIDRLILGSNILIFLF